MEASKVQVVDNFLWAHDFLLIKAALLDPEFEWHFNDKVIDGPVLDAKNVTYQFVKVFYTNNSVISPRIDLLAPLMAKLPIRSLIRIKANFNPASNKQVASGFHTDFDFPESTTAVFYLNTNNGYTLFENGEKVESVENRLVLFPSTSRHSGVECTDAPYRLLLNINFF